MIASKSQQWYVVFITCTIKDISLVLNYVWNSKLHSAIFIRYNCKARFGKTFHAVYGGYDCFENIRDSFILINM